MAYADSTHRSIDYHCKLFSDFCSSLDFTPFPVTKVNVFRYRLVARFFNGEVRSKEEADQTRPEEQVSMG